MANHVEILVRELAGNQTKFAQMLGVSQPAVKNYISRGALSRKAASKLLELHPELSSRYIMTGEGEMYEERAQNYYSDLHVQAGEPWVQQNMGEPSGIIDIPGVHADFFFPVTGNSMRPLIEPGDVIGVKAVDINDYIDPDKCYLLIIKGMGRVVKHVMPFTKKDELITLKSTNNEFTPMTVRKEDITNIFKVVFLGRSI